MADRPDHIQIWAAQLATGDFPPVCAMTGRPAETWRKFLFGAPPASAQMILVIATGGLLAWPSRTNARGHLPLTRASSRKVALAKWSPAGLLVGTIALWILGAVLGLTSDSANRDIWTAWSVLLIVGWLSLLGSLVISSTLGPRGKVMKQKRGWPDKIVELHNLHPTFVTAVNQMHIARAAQHGLIPSPDDTPLPPGSN